MMADYGSARVLSFFFLELSEDVQGSETATVLTWGLDMTQGAVISTFFFLFFFWMLICPMWSSSCVHVCVYISCMSHMTKVTCVLTPCVLYDQFTCVCMYPNSLRSHMIKIMCAYVCPYLSYMFSFMNACVCIPLHLPFLFLHPELKTYTWDSDSKHFVFS